MIDKETSVMTASAAHGAAAVRPGASSSALQRALNLLGDPWALQIIKEAFLGVRRFQHFQGRLAIPRQTLAVRLNLLTDGGVFYKKPVQLKRIIYEYRLTPKGIDLYYFNLMVWRWHKRWHLDERKLPAELFHRPCGRSLQPQLVCGGCTQPFGPEEISITPGAGRAEPITTRQVRIVNGLASLDENNLATVVIGDRWSILVLNAILRGYGHYVRLLSVLNISNSVLSRRLKTLQSLQLVTQQRNRRDGRSYDYSLTEKGRDVHTMIVTLVHWADRWLAGSAGPPEIFRHKPCGSILDPYAICHACKARLRFGEVRAVFRHGRSSGVRRRAS